MKCLSCGKDHNRKERLAFGGRCSQCGHEFAFEPTEGHGITDRMFASAIERLSMSDTLFFTVNQLFYGLQSSLDKRSSKEFKIGMIGTIFFVFLPLIVIKSVLISLGLLVVFGYSSFSHSTNRGVPFKLRKNNLTAVQLLSLLVIGLGCLELTLPPTPPSNPIVVGFSFLLGLGGMVAALIQKQRIKPYRTCWILRDRFLALLSRWSAVNGDIPSLVVPRRGPAPPGLTLSDVEAYSFDRLIVCDREEMVEFLLANHVHFEHNCAILSIGGYPKEIFATTLAMVKRNPSLLVYALHDCSPSGLQVAYQLRTAKEWFAEQAIPILDIGLVPRQVINNPASMLVRQSAACKLEANGLPAEIRQTFQPDELAWLDQGYFVELESIPPQRLLRILRRSLLELRELESLDESGLILIGAGSAYDTAQTFG